MAVRTGTQLRADMAAADTAVTTLNTTPTEANLNAAVAAFRVVERNGADSKAVTATRGGQRVGGSISNLAGGFARDLVMGATKGLAASDLRLLVKRVQRRQTSGPWQHFRNETTNT